MITVTVTETYYPVPGMVRYTAECVTPVDVATVPAQVRLFSAPCPTREVAIEALRALYAEHMTRDKKRVRVEVVDLDFDL